MKVRKSELRRYLLAEPGAEGHEAVEAWLGEVDNEEFAALLGDIEDELIDGYVWDELSEDEISGFESNFLGPAERRRKLSFSLSFGRALKDHVERQAAHRSRKDERPPRDPPPARQRLPAFVSHPAWGLAIAATLVAIVIGGIWVFVDYQRLESPLARESSGRTAVPGELMPIASIWLSPGLMRGRGEMERVILPLNIGLVELLLDLGVDDYGSYRAALLDAEGDETWTQAKLEAKDIQNRVAVVVTLPDTLLPQGDYSIRLSGATASGDLELAGRYYFRVLRD